MLAVWEITEFVIQKRNYGRRELRSNHRKRRLQKKKKSRKEGNKTLETAIRYIKEQINSFVIDKNHYHKVMPLCVKKTRINKMYNRNYLFLAK